VEEAKTAVVEATVGTLVAAAAVVSPLSASQGPPFRAHVVTKKSSTDGGASTERPESENEGHYLFQQQQQQQQQQLLGQKHERGHQGIEWS
jgi:hypothetical protein